MLHHLKPLWFRDKIQRHQESRSMAWRYSCLPPHSKTRHSWYSVRAPPALAVSAEAPGSRHRWSLRQDADFCLSSASAMLLEAAGVLRFGITSLVSHLLHQNVTQQSTCVSIMRFLVGRAISHVSAPKSKHGASETLNRTKSQVPHVCVCLCKGKLGFMTTFCREKHVKAVSCDRPPGTESKAGHLDLECPITCSPNITTDVGVGDPSATSSLGYLNRFRCPDKALIPPFIAQRAVLCPGLHAPGPDRLSRNESQCG